jgi:hypothetical protein
MTLEKLCFNPIRDGIITIAGQSIQRPQMYQEDDENDDKFLSGFRE